MSAALAELRHLHLERRRALAEGGAVEPLDAAMSRVEASIVDRSRRARTRHGEDEAVPSVETLRRRLGDAVLVCFLDVEGTLWAVRVDERRATLHELTPSESVRSESAYVMSSVRRLLVAGSHDRLQSSAVNSLAVAASRLDGMVFRALNLDPAVPVVVVPPAIMHGLPWSVLPSLERRSFVVAPSATAWWQRSAPGAPPPEGPSVGMVAGPELPAGRREVLALARRYATATTLVGRGATAAATLDLLADSDLVHLAAHGTFRSDSPLFSSLRLADGPLTVYDLEQLPRVAPTIVLSSCHAATAAVRAGDELLGTATALLGLGVRSLLAPVGAVPDDATRPLMLDVHDALLASARPADALAAARRQRADDPLSAVAAGLFLCLGAAGEPIVRARAPVSSPAYRRRDRSAAAATMVGATAGQTARAHRRGDAIRAVRRAR
jgi:hypothetical protein